MRRGAHSVSSTRYLISLVLSILILGGFAAPGSAQDDASGPLLRATVDSLPDLPAVVDLTRIVLAPGAGVELTVPGPSIYAVESGAFGLRLEGPAQLIRAETDAPTTAEAARPGVDYVLRPGDQAAVPANINQLLLNDSQAPAEVLSV